MDEEKLENLSDVLFLVLSNVLDVFFVVKIIYFDEINFSGKKSSFLN